MLRWLFRRVREKPSVVKLTGEGERLVQAYIAFHGVPGLSPSAAIEIVLRERAAELGIGPTSPCERAG